MTSDVSYYIVLLDYISQTEDNDVYSHISSYLYKDGVTSAEINIKDEK